MRSVWALQLVGIVVAARLVGLLGLFIGHERSGRSVSTLATVFDGAFYRVIATVGYPSSLPHNAAGQVLKNPTAFFPLYPLVDKAVMDATGLSFATAALIVNLLACVAAALLIADIWTFLGEDRETGFYAAALWAVWPLSLVASMAYSESLMTALAAASLLSLLRRRWITAGIFAALAGATRPNGAILIICCAVAAGMAIHKGREWRSLLAVILSPIGTLGYLMYLGVHTGVATAWLKTEDQGWQVYFDAGVHNVHSVLKYVRTDNKEGFLLVFAVLVCIALTAWLVAQKTHPILLIWTAGIVLLAITTRNDFSSVPRFCWVAFPITLPIARWLRDSRAWIRGALLMLSAAAMAVGTVFITVYSHYPP